MANQKQSIKRFSILTLSTDLHGNRKDCIQKQNLVCDWHIVCILQICMQMCTSIQKYTKGIYAKKKKKIYTHITFLIDLSLWDNCKT